MLRPSFTFENIDRKRVPPNVKFDLHDVQEPWIRDNFDYIFSRYMATFILDWPKLVENAFEIVSAGWPIELTNRENPGGLAEFSGL